MRRGILPVAIAASIILTAGSAYADGYEKRPAAGAAPASLPVSDWIGPYAGANAGYGWNTNSALVSGDVPTGAGSAILNHVFAGVISGAVNQFSQGSHSNGFVGGGQAGYNMRFGQWVTGLETDIQYADVDGNATTIGGPIPGQPFTGTVDTKQELNWFGTLRGRIGFLPLEHVLVFGTGGLAYGGTDVSANVTTSPTIGIGAATGLLCIANTTCIAGSNSRTSVGWTAGGGIEVIVWGDVTLKAEYLHVDLGDQNITLAVQPPSIGDGFATASFDNAYEIVRAGINVPFSPY